MMDITTYPGKKTNDIELEKSQEETCSKNFLQKSCKGMLNTKLKFHGKEEHNVVIGRCFRHGKRGCIVYRGLDTNTGNLVVVIKWTFPLRDNNLAVDNCEVLQRSQICYLKQIQAIEQTFKNLKLVNFKHLVHYLGMQHILKKDKVIVYVLQEFVCGNNMEQLFQNIPVTIPWLQHYAKQILEALQILHREGFVHENLRLSSIFIDGSGSVKLADYCLDQRLHFLSKVMSQREDVNHYLSAIDKCSSKNDIYNFGALILKLIIGPFKAESSIVIPDYINPVLKDFLYKCLSHNEQELWSAEQLLSHPFLNPCTVTLDLFRDNRIANEIKPDYLVNSDRCNSNNSRLTTEFNILKSLGKGGFGHVWKVQNKLDSRIYALKRIPLNPHNKQLNHKIMREVQLLSRLSHENIVRYYNSWIETVPGEPSFQSRTILHPENEHHHDEHSHFESSDAHDEHFGIVRYYNSWIETVPGEPSFQSRTVWHPENEHHHDEHSHFESSDAHDEHFGIVRCYNSWIETVPDEPSFQNRTILHPENEHHHDEHSRFESSDAHDEHFASDEGDSDDHNDSVIFLNENDFDKERVKESNVDDSVIPKLQSLVLNQAPSTRIKHYMYIQMEFCENSTLQTAIDADLYRDVPRLWRLFKEIIEGLHYIHQQGVIHRDLKPVNIFLDSNDHVKIGDFGLATDVISKTSTLETTCNGSENKSCLNAHYASQTGGVGTAFYVAPELASSDKVRYNQKVDIYSLGIIFFEMCFPPPVTFMERCKILTDLRNQDIILPDKAYELLNDDMIHLIIWLLQHDITKRPTSAELIASKYISPLSMAESEYFIFNTSIIAITSPIN